MTNKVILIVCDGLGDRPIPELGNLTPLESAKTPNLDKLAERSITGLMDPIGVGIRPGSDVSHLSILGYDSREYYHGRGPIEAAGVGIDLQKGDIAFRGNLGTVDEHLVIKDRRAGRIESTAELIKDIDGTVIDGVKFILKPGTAHRVGVVMRGNNLSSKISDSDPHEVGQNVRKVLSLDNSKEAKFTADVLNKFLDKSHKILKEHPFNKKRIKDGLLPGNYLLLRGAGYVADIPPFEKRYELKAACVAGAGLYKGISRLLGMDVINVEGATGLPNTNVRAKLETAKNFLDKYDFVFVHIKAADSLGEDGNFVEKKKFIEKIDSAMEVLLDVDALVVVTADHSTPCELKMHSGDPVPILMCGRGIRKDSVNKFGERDCANGGLGRIKGLDVMNEILNIIGKAHLQGA